MSGEVRKTIGALEVLVKQLEHDGKVVHAEALNKLSAALDALLACIKGIEEDICTVNERLCDLETKQKPAGFVDTGE